MGFQKWTKSVGQRTKKNVKRIGQGYRRTAKELGPEMTATATAALAIYNPALGAVAAKAQQRWQEGVAERRYENSLDEQPQLEPFTPEQAEIKREFITAKKESVQRPGDSPTQEQGSRGVTPGLRSAVFDIPILGDLFAFLFGAR